MTRAQRWRSHIFAALVALVAVAPTAWLLLDREPPVVAIAVVGPSDVRAGEDLRVSYIVNRRRICETTVFPVLYDGENIRHIYEPERMVDPGDIGRESFTVRRRVPAAAEPGEARYRVVLEWVCPPNIIHRVWPVKAVLPEVTVTIRPPSRGE